MKLLKDWLFLVFHQVELTNNVQNKSLWFLASLGNGDTYSLCINSTFNTFVLKFCKNKLPEMTFESHKGFFCLVVLSNNSSVIIQHFLTSVFSAEKILDI